MSNLPIDPTEDIFERRRKRSAAALRGVRTKRENFTTYPSKANRHRLIKNISFSAAIRAFRTFEDRVLDAERSAPTEAKRRSSEDLAVADLIGFFAEHAVTLVDDRPAPFPSARERATIVETVNGVWRGYTVEVAPATEHDERFPRAELDGWKVRFVHWEGFDDESSCSIVDIVEVDASWVIAKLRPRAGLVVRSGHYRSGYHRYATAPVRAALDELERRRAVAMIASTVDEPA